MLYNRQYIMKPQGLKSLLSNKLHRTFITPTVKTLSSCIQKPTWLPLNCRASDAGAILVQKGGKECVDLVPNKFEDYSSTSDEWVEQTIDSSTLVSKEESLPVKPSHDGWSTNASIFSGVTRKELQQSKEKKKDEKDDKKYMLDTLGQTERELNPYWKGGGSGLPSGNPVAADSLRQATVTVGDQGVAWLRRALQRATEQAVEQRRPLRDVVAERWGSLEKLESMIATAEERENKSGSNRRENSGKHNEGKHRRQDREKYNDVKKYDKYKSTYRQGKSKDYSSSEEAKRSAKSTKCKSLRDFSKERKSFSKPQDSSDDNSSSEVQRNNHELKKRFSKSCTNKFARPSNTSSEDERGFHSKNDSFKRGKHTEQSKHYVSDRYKKRRSRSSSSSGSSSSEDERTVSKRGNTEYEHSRSKESKRFSKHNHDSEESRRCYPKSGKGWKKRTEPEDKKRISENDNKQDSKKSEGENVKEVETTPAVEEVVLTDKEMNDLAAKLVKAELLGNVYLAKELKAKLERARETKSSRGGQVEAREEVVILTYTDSKGFTRPVSLGAPEKSGGRRKAKKVETHSEGKRTRYFADDDKYNLQEMFTREKLSTVEDSNEVFAKLAAKSGSRQDMDDVFEETACMEEADGKKHTRERQQAISESKRVARSLDNCQWCLESRQMLKHLIVAIGNQCYLCVPPYQSLTENHCLIVPSHHSACGTQLDEDVWAEIQEFRKCLVQMFLSQGEDVLFFETARQLNRFPHMVLSCVPVPKETGDMAPIYFKKAIQECEMEWSDNKKLVDLRGRDVRRAVPKGLPYFSVDFGMDSGFAHVIENEQLFPPNFAQEIIGGMLDLDHTIWRKQRKQTFEEQSKKVISLTKLWNPYDFTKTK